MSSQDREWIGLRYLKMSVPESSMTEIGVEEQRVVEEHTYKKGNQTMMSAKRVPGTVNQYPFLAYEAVALPALGRLDSSFEFPDISMSGKGDTPPESLRPPALGRPIRLFDSAAGNLDARIVILDCSEGSCGRALRPSLWWSRREE